ncbi:hypothetical protein ACQJBY_004622 [Aegilops geniculata]
MKPDVPWIVGLVSLMVAWFVNPILAYYVPKILSAIGLGASKRLSDLEIHIIPKLKETLRGVDQARMMKRTSKEKDDLARLDKMAARLRHALEDAQDICDDQHEIESYRSRFPQRFWSGLNIGWGWIASIVLGRSARLWRWVRKIYLGLSEVTASAAATCVVSCMPVTQIVRSGFSGLSRLARMMSSAVVATCVAGFNRSWMLIAGVSQIGTTRLSMLTLRGSNDTLPVYKRPQMTHSQQRYTGRTLPADVSSGTNVSDETLPAEIEIHSEGEPLTTSELASDEPAVLATNNDAASQGPIPENSITRFSMWIASLGQWLSRCRTSIHSASETATTFRDKTCEGIGFTSHKEDASASDFVLTAISIWKLKRKIKKIESTVNDVKKSPLFVVATESELEDIANKSRSSISTGNEQKVFGRERLLYEIVARLFNQPPNSDKCYSVFGIHGVSGCGKTAFARYTRDYIEKRKIFHIIMCVHLSKTSSVDGIFQEMLGDIAGEQHTNISDGEKLQEKSEEPLQGKKLKKKLEDSLRGKRFFLILDDLWVEERTNKQLNELLSPLNVGQQGSKILVTARTDTAVKVLCDENITVMPDMHEELFYEMFMHYALNPEGEHEHDEEREKLGRSIAKKLPKSPIAAVIVAGQLRLNYRIKFWRRTAESSKFVNTWDALWWSYQELPLDIRRCLEYCNIFPRRTNLKTEDLVRLWIAQGFVKSSTSEDMELEDIAEGYVQKLASCSFLKQTMGRDDCFTIHDLLHDLLDEVVGSDCFQIENGRSEQGGKVWNGIVPREVRHLFVQKYDGELITAKIRGLENLRTLIIYVVETDTTLEEDVVDRICKSLPKLRVLIIAFSSAIQQDEDFSFPESIGQLKHLRYFGFGVGCMVILPSTLSKLINLLYIICTYWKFANIERLISLRAISSFTVRNEEGCEVNQLRGLNKIRGKLEISGLENVKSNDEAVEAYLADKVRLTGLDLNWGTRHRAEVDAEVDANVLESLCPPEGLETLTINGYQGSRYPDWMVVGKQKGGPTDLQTLQLRRCRPAHELGGFPRLRLLLFKNCSRWLTLPGNLEHLTFLKELIIDNCLTIESLPTLPKSLEVFRLNWCEVKFMQTCQTKGHPNWEKIRHIPGKYINPPHCKIFNFVSQEKGKRYH